MSGRDFETARRYDGLGRGRDRPFRPSRRDLPATAKQLHLIGVLGGQPITRPPLTRGQASETIVRLQRAIAAAPPRTA